MDCLATTRTHMTCDKELSLYKLRAKYYQISPRRGLQAEQPAAGKDSRKKLGMKYPNQQSPKQSTYDTIKAQNMSNMDINKTQT